MGVFKSEVYLKIQAFSIGLFVTRSYCPQSPGYNTSVASISKVGKQKLMRIWGRGFFDNYYSQDYDKILERDWLSQARFEH